MNSHSPGAEFKSAHSIERRTRCRVEDILARWTQVESCLNVIKVQAWNQGSWAAAGIEARTALKEGKAAKDELSAIQRDLTAIIEGVGDD